MSCPHPEAFRRAACIGDKQPDRRSVRAQRTHSRLDPQHSIARRQTERARGGGGGRTQSGAMNSKGV